jgi:2,3,4,5-tetrahydropyridine-2,6-dicarboxylate N-succinyltransferase
METLINQAWELRSDPQKITRDMKEAVIAALDGLDKGALRVVSVVNSIWKTEEWLKKVVLLSFLIFENKIIFSESDIPSYDKMPLKFSGWDKGDFEVSGFRAVPGAIVRYSAYIARKVVLMPCFVNLASYIDEGTLIDSFVTVGSCARIGKNCHISMGVGIGGVLEPLQNNPVIIEDDVFIGAASQILEGVIVEKGSVISNGVNIGASTKIYDRQNDKILFGKVPAYSVVVPGVLPGSDSKTSIGAAVIVKTIDEQTRMKTAINEILRV